MPSLDTPKTSVKNHRRFCITKMKTRMRCRINQTKKVPAMPRNKAKSRHNECDIVLLEELVLQYHLMWKIDKDVDFSFIHGLCKDLYSPNIGRPPAETGCCFACCFWGICTEYHLKPSWLRPSMRISPSNGFWVWTWTKKNRIMRRSASIAWAALRTIVWTRRY